MLQEQQCGWNEAATAGDVVAPYAEAEANAEADNCRTVVVDADGFALLSL